MANKPLKTLTIGSDLEIARDVVASAENHSKQALVKEIFRFDGVQYYERTGNITVHKEVTIDASRVESILKLVNYLLGSDLESSKRLDDVISEFNKQVDEQEEEFEKRIAAQREYLDRRISECDAQLQELLKSAPDNGKERERSV